MRIEPSSARDDLQFVHDHTVDLANSRLRGTRERWTESHVSTEEWAKIVERDQAERADRNELAPGYTLAPVVVSALDLLHDVVETLGEHVDALADELLATQRPQRISSTQDPRPFITWLRNNLDDASSELANNIRDDAKRLSREMARTLGLLRVGQTLKAPCPWCRGVTDKAPGGGAFTMMVHELPGGEGLIVCVNPVCEPTEGDVGTWLYGRPAWTVNEWEWLAKRIDHANEAAS